MGATEDIADKLAEDTLAVIDEHGDLSLIDDLSKLLEASSSAAHEAFMASIRARAALARARKLLDTRIKALEARAGEAAAPPAAKAPAPDPAARK